MKIISVEKITLNIGTGEPGDKLAKAIKLLNMVSGAKSAATKSKRRIPTWGIRPGLEIGCKVTLRKKIAEEKLRDLLKAVGNKLKDTNFDDGGNFSFGIHEYLDIPNVKYDASIGIIGLEVAVTLKRPGFRIKYRKLKKATIGKKHAIRKEEAKKFMIEKFNVGIEE